MVAYRWFLAGFLLMLFAFAHPTMAQRQRIDSLKTTLTRKLADTTRANTYYEIANAYYGQSQFDSATYYLALARPLYRRNNHTRGLGDYNRLRGIMSLRQGLLEDALNFDQAAIREYARIGKTQSIALVYNNMGWLYKIMGETQQVQAYAKEGLAYVHKAIVINQRLNAYTSLVDNYVNLGIIHEDLGEFKLGRDCFFKAIAINEQIRAKPEANRILYNNLGKNYNVEGQYQQAITYLNKSLVINLQLKKYSSLAHNYRNLATAYMGLKQPKEALDYAEKALEQVKLSKELPIATSVYGTLAKAYAAAGQYQKAYESVLERKQIEDSLMSLEKTRTIARLQGRYQVQQTQALATTKADLELAKTREMARVEAEKAAAIATIQRDEKQQMALIRAQAEIEKTRAVADIQTKYNTQQRLQQIATLNQQNEQRSDWIQQMKIGFGLLLLLVSLLLGQYFMIRRANRRLAAQNVIIQQNSQQLVVQSDQLRTLMKELHHRVKNNLAIVSSLLNLQVSGMHDEKAIQAVRVGQQRVEAMSLIHQQLYRTDQLTIINMREYLSNLAESLMRAYGYNHSTFDLQIEVEKIELDVEIAIPIGLIVNELMTNAFKHAYHDQPYPFLRIRLGADSKLPVSGLTLEVEDNGVGFDIINWQKSAKVTSFGKLLITSLSEQLEGRIELSSTQGTHFKLRVPATRLATAAQLN